MQRVFLKCRGAGFQEEKYETLLLRVSWTREQLEKMLELRINQVLRDRYDGSKVITCAEVLTGGKNFSPISYLLERSFNRPRDVIAFLNHCIVAAEAGPITRQKIELAEKSYSRSRLISLADEWRGTYRGLDYWAQILLERRSFTFKISDIDPIEVMNKCVEVGVSVPSESMPEHVIKASELVDHAVAFIRFAVAALCRAELLGLKLHSDERFLSGPDLPQQTVIDALHSNVITRVHPMFWAALHIRPDK